MGSEMWEVEMGCGKWDVRNKILEVVCGKLDVGSGMWKVEYGMWDM